MTDDKAGSKSMKDKIYKVENEKSLPANALIENLRFKGSGWYTTTWNKIHKSAREGLVDAGYFVLSDLEGTSESILMEINGVGFETANRLLKAAKKASVTYRGVGFPWEINNISVIVPNDYVEYVDGIGILEARKIVEHYLTNNFFPSIAETALSLRRQTLQTKKDALQDDLDRIDEQLKKLEA